MNFEQMRKLAEMSAFHSKCDRVDEAVAFIRAFYKSIWTRSTTAEDEQKFEDTMAELEFLLDEAMGKHIDFQWKDM